MIERGTARGSISLQVRNGIFWVKVLQDPRGSDLVAAFQEARRSRLLVGPMPTVVDMLDYNGSIDWWAIGAIRDMTPWERQRRQGEDESNPTLARCAYVSRDMLLAPVIKIICDLFGRSRHRQFRDAEQAVLWVLQPEAPPPGHAILDDD
ncbi:MAG TPA: hypothetical protein VN229_20720 [Terriglobales bacterium]|nr:hypothetical protein [Terriglobales bacterium]